MQTKKMQKKSFKDSKHDYMMRLQNKTHALDCDVIPGSFNKYRTRSFTKMPTFKKLANPFYNSKMKTND